jgi:hypothetical protein
MRGSDDFFHSRIDQMIDLRDPLAVDNAVSKLEYGTEQNCDGVW